MRFWGSGALRYVKSEERTPLERMIANKWGGQFAVSARSLHTWSFPMAVVHNPYRHNTR